MHKVPLADRVRVKETFPDETVWEGEVLVFQLLGLRSSVKCYWEVDGEITIVLGEPPVNSPQAAVRASIMAP